ncbi:MAG: GntR family transcriptional regulator [Deltaproteobacteria bacterium]|nr:GntR family transcriptional regulator [Deltaproteobacteria bacterium]
MRVNRQRLSNQVYDILKDMIANHRFNSGTRINVEQITKEVGASRTPVWEAVHRLIQEGLLVSIPNRGVFMAALTPKHAIELYMVREVLEGLAARLAIANMDDKTLKKMTLFPAGLRFSCNGL